MGRLLSSRTLTVGALVLWCGSLAFTALVLYAKQQRLPAIEVLAFGWLSPLALNFAWFANPVFVVACLRLMQGKSAVTLSILAVVLSLDTFRFTTYLLDEGGATTPVYGYGWGAALWFSSFAVLLAAAGTRQIETRLRTRITPSRSELLRPFGLVYCVVIAGTIAYFAASDRARANSVEKQRLAGLAFKRGPVCSVEPQKVSNPIRELGGGALELKVSDGVYRSLAHPLNRPMELLSWGVPTVRVGGRDYSLEATEDGPLLTSLPWDAAASVLLTVEVTSQRPLAINATLSDPLTNRRVFERTWRYEAGDARLCPDYSTFPREDEEPRKLLMEALSLLPAAQTAASAQKARSAGDNRVTAIVEKITAGNRGDSSAVEIKPTRYGGAAFKQWVGNRNCPADVGWDGHGHGDSASRLGTGWPFMVGNKAFYPKAQGTYEAWCGEGDVYLFEGTARDGKYYLFLDKRRLPDFSRRWTGIAVIEDPSLATRDNVLKVRAVHESANGVFIETVHDDNGTIASLRAPLTVAR